MGSRFRGNDEQKATGAAPAKLGAMADLLARILFLLATLLTRLPWPWLLRLGDGIARWMLRRDTREARVARRNLELIEPDLLPAQRDELQQRIVHTTARQAIETLRLWTHPHTENLALIRERHGVELFDAAIAAGRGVIVAAPHYGNWELLNQWLASHTPLAILYAPPESPIGDAFLRRVRADETFDHAERSGAGAESKCARVTQVRAEGPGVRQLFKILKDGGVVGILPDQQPKQGDGEFAPFFGVPALTRTLLGRLGHRTGAAFVFAWC